MKILIDKEFDIWMDIAYASDSQILVKVSKADKCVDVEGWVTITDEERRRAMPTKEDFFVVKPRKIENQPSFYSLTPISYYFISFGGLYAAIKLRPLRSTHVALSEDATKRGITLQDCGASAPLPVCETVLINCTAAQCEFKNSK